MHLLLQLLPQRLGALSEVALRLMVKCPELLELLPFCINLCPFLNRGRMTPKKEKRKRKRERENTLLRATARRSCRVREAQLEKETGRLAGRSVYRGVETAAATGTGC